MTTNDEGPTTVNDELITDQQQTNDRPTIKDNKQNKCMKSVKRKTQTFSQEIVNKLEKTIISFTSSQRRSRTSKQPLQISPPFRLFSSITARTSRPAFLSSSTTKTSRSTSSPSDLRETSLLSFSSTITRTRQNHLYLNIYNYNISVSETELRNEDKKKKRGKKEAK
ncbi:hypothetical protein Glove_41g168 [Diversispora epigaea]|uniref:Uncharacterized protein n=1 Tax=Diversispora epigaea TaxID=1348612 RepID=A0A397JM53_9GLOM|nr:hypothetical protein Glove_41g168 [Diversispora epigaea]